MIPFELQGIYDRSDSFPFDYKSNGTALGSYDKENCYYDHILNAVHSSTEIDFGSLLKCNRVRKNKCVAEINLTGYDYSYNFPFVFGTNLISVWVKNMARILNIICL